MANNQKRKRISLWKIYTLILIVLLIASVLTDGFSFSQKEISKKKAGEKAINYINLDLAELDANAVLEDVVDEKGLYKIVFSIEEMEDSKLNAYVTKDGKLMFPYSYKLDEGLPNIPSEVLNQEPLPLTAVPINQ